MKKQVNITLIVVIVLAIFNTIALIAPFVRTAAFWCAYGFSVAAILIWGGVWLSLGVRSTTQKSRFYGWPMIYLVSVYMTIQVVLGVTFMFFSGSSVRAVVIINTVLLLICLVGLISTDTAKDSIETIDETVKRKVLYIRSLENEMTHAANMCDDLPTRKKLIAVANAIRYSNPMSDGNLFSLEEEISRLCSRISELIRYQDTETIRNICSQLLIMIEERNQKCKLMK